MKIFISYFYQIRFMPNNLIPVSTAIWDPIWYHDSMGTDHIYQDNSGRIIGLRIPELSPIKVHSEPHCSKGCLQNPDSCGFKSKYYQYLCELDFNKLMDHITEISKMSQGVLELNELPDVCLLVHEATNNKCSERESIIKYFNNYGVIVTEWTPNE